MAVISLLVAGVVAPSTAHADSLGVISGFVTNTGGTPLAGVWIEAYDALDAEGNPSTVTSDRTDEHGHYWIAVPDRATTRLRAAVDGYAITYSGNVFRPSKAAQIPLTKGPQRRDLRLPSSSMATGRVLLPSGEPARSAVVRVGFGRTGEFVPGRTAVVESDGSFVIEGLPPGQFTIRAEPGSEEPQFVPTYLPSTESPAAAALRGWSEGATASVGTIQTLEGASITGKVLTASGKPVAYGSVVLTDRSTGSGWLDEPRRAETDVDGRYVISHVPAASYTPHATGAGVAPLWSGNALAPKDAVPVTVPSGQSVTQDFIGLVRSSSVAVFGAFWDSQCSSDIAIYNSDGSIVGSARWNEGGMTPTASNVLVPGRSYRLGLLNQSFEPVAFYQRARTLAEATPFVAPEAGTKTTLTLHLPAPDACRR